MNYGKNLKKMQQNARCKCHVLRQIGETQLHNNMTPYIIERQLNVSQLDVFRLMMDSYYFLVLVVTIKLPNVYKHNFYF
jgi:hypothetical protein